MVDPIDVFLVENLQDRLVELARGNEIASKWLLDDDASPPSLAAVQTGGPQSFDDGGRLRSRSREIKQVIRAGTGRLHFIQSVAQLIVKRRIVDVTGKIVQTLFEFLPGRVGKISRVACFRSRFMHS